MARSSKSTNVTTVGKPKSRRPNKRGRPHGLECLPGKMITCRHTLFDFLVDNGYAKCDADIARKMDVAGTTISRIRHNKLSLGSRYILKLHEAFNIPVSLIRRMT